MLERKLEAMKIRKRKLDWHNQIKWLGSQFYLVQIYTDFEISELWIFRDSTGFGARINLTHDEQLQLSKSFVISDEIIKAAMETIKNQLMYDGEKLEVTGNEFFIN